MALRREVRRRARVGAGLLAVSLAMLAPTSGCAPAARATGRGAQHAATALPAPSPFGLEAGLLAYDAKDFAAARAAFLDLAEIGNARAQYNLGAMTLKGEGASKDRGVAAGWMLAARENGYDPTPRALDALVSELSDQERASANEIVAQAGRAPLTRTIPPPRYGTAGFEPARVAEGHSTARR